MITVIAQSLPLRLLKMVAVIIAVMIVAMGDEMIEVMAVVYFVIRVGVRFIAMQCLIGTFVITFTLAVLFAMT